MIIIAIIITIRHPSSHWKVKSVQESTLPNGCGYLYSEDITTFTGQLRLMGLQTQIFTALTLASKWNSVDFNKRSAWFPDDAVSLSNRSRVYRGMTGLWFGTVGVVQCLDKLITGAAHQPCRTTPTASQSCYWVEFSCSYCSSPGCLKFLLMKRFSSPGV